MKRRSEVRYVVLLALATMGVTTHSDQALGQFRVPPSKDEAAGDRKTIPDEINGPQACSTSYDRFKNAVTTTLEARTIYRAGIPRHEIRMGASAVVEKGETPKEVELIFEATSESARTRFYDKADVMFIVNGERTEGGTAYKMGGFSLRQFDETLRLTLPANRLLEIIHGREVEMRIGQTEITLRREDLQRLRTFAACVNLRVE